MISSVFVDLLLLRRIRIRLGLLVRLKFSIEFLQLLLLLSSLLFLRLVCCFQLLIFFAITFYFVLQRNLGCLEALLLILCLQLLCVRFHFKLKLRIVLLQGTASAGIEVNTFLGKWSIRLCYGQLPQLLLQVRLQRELKTLVQFKIN